MGSEPGGGGGVGCVFVRGGGVCDTKVYVCMIKKRREEQGFGVEFGRDYEGGEGGNNDEDEDEEDDDD